MADEGWYSNESATFGDRVAAARDAAGLSREDLSRRLGVKLKTVVGWEEDLAEPRANKLQMLSGVLNVSLMWLLNGEGDGLENPEDAYELSPVMGDLLTEMRALKAQMLRSAERVGKIERKLRRALKDGAA